MNLLSFNFINAGPYNFWIIFALVFISIGFLSGYFLTFWGSVFFLSFNTLIFTFFFIISSAIYSFSDKLWFITVDIQPLVLISNGTKVYIENILPIIILISSIIILNLILFLFYLFFVKKIIKSRNIGTLNKITGSFLGGFEFFVFISLFFGIIGSGIFYTNSSTFAQTINQILKNPSLLNSYHNNLSSTIFYNFFLFLVN